MSDTGNSTHGGGWLFAFLLLAVTGPAVAANTYFVRADGGSAQECTGLADQPYPGSGTARDCAWSHPFVALPPGGSPRIAGGDTLIIGAGDYRMGYGAPATESCAQAWSWDCHMPPIPGGPSPDQPTRILGQGHDNGCPAAPELWGTERAATVLNLTGSANVELACLEVTDRASCIEFHYHGGSGGGEVAACNRQSAPWGDWAASGITASDSSNVVLTDVNIHGLANQGVHAGRLADWTLERVRINANGWAGWDGDIGSDSSNSGTLLFVDSEIAWNGCVEDWQSGDKFGCWAQGGGGYGDGLGVGESGGNWIFDNVSVHHNTSDGIDLLYLRGDGQATVRRSLIDSNAGNQVKISRNAVIENSVIIGNCAYFAGHPNMHDGDLCRALGDAVYVGFSGDSRADLINNTIVGQGNCVISGGGGSSRSVLKIANNLIIGNPYWHNPDQQSCLYYSGSDEQIVWESNFIKDVRHGACPGNSQCGSDPGIASHDLRSFDPEPVAGSALIAAADPTLAPADDFHGLARGAGGGPDIGAIEYDAEPAAPAPEPPSAGFTYSCSALTCSFVADTSQGGERAYQWSLGDGSYASGSAITHRYAAEGSYAVELTVTDSDSGLSDSSSQTIVITDPGGWQPAIRLHAQAVAPPRDGSHFVRLQWRGVTTEATDIYRNDTIIASTFSYQLYADRIARPDAGALVYRVCEHGTQSCSDEVQVNFSRRGR